MANTFPHDLSPALPEVTSNDRQSLTLVSCSTDMCRYSVSPGTPDFQALDTNGDGQLTMADNMYTPYYPGDQYVDWVGMSIYNFGSGQTSSSNSIAPANKLANTVSQHCRGLHYASLVIWFTK